MQTVTTWCRSFRGLNSFSGYVVNTPLLSRLRSVPRPAQFQYIHQHASIMSSSFRKRLKSKYKIPDDFRLIYIEPRSHINMMLFLRASEWFFICSPLLLVANLYAKNATFAQFFEQENCALIITVIAAYVTLFHHFTGSYVEAIFHNPETGVYRIYLFRRFTFGLRYIEFFNYELKSAMWNKNIPSARIVFKLGKQSLLIHDGLFVDKMHQYELTHEALKEFYKEKK